MSLKQKNQCWANDLAAHKCEAKRPGGGGGNYRVGTMASAPTRPCGVNHLAGLCLAPTRHTHGVEGGREKRERERAGERTISREREGEPPNNICIQEMETLSRTVCGRGNIAGRKEHWVGIELKPRRNFVPNHRCAATPQDLNSTLGATMLKTGLLRLRGSI